MTTQQMFFNPHRQTKPVHLKMAQIGVPAQQRDNFFSGGLTQPHG
jgi:hypothetical protein